MPVQSPSHQRPRRSFLLAAITVLFLSGCASNRASLEQPDFAGRPETTSPSAIAALSARYKSHPRDKVTLITFAAALRGVGQAEQAVSVLEGGLATHRNDFDIKLAYAKALTSAGRFQQAMNIVDDAVDPAAPDWNALLVRGAILDQNGDHQAAREAYGQALLVAPNRPAIRANLGLSYAMTNNLVAAETELRRAATMPGATSQIRQNLALVVGLQGRFDECEALYGRELPPDHVAANLAYVRALITQQNRWELIKGAKKAA